MNQTNAKDVVLIVGTGKGAFILRSHGGRDRWDVSEPQVPGENVYSAAIDQRAGRNRIWLGAGRDHFAAELAWSDDLGKTWHKPQTPSIQYPKDTGLAVTRLWQLHVPASGDENTLYCGVEPAGLFVSKDAGESWSLVRPLHDHPHRAKWSPGGGGLCMHTITSHPTKPNELLVAVSTGGCYRTTDGGATWNSSNDGIRADFLPEKRPQFGQCVHKVARDPSNPDRLYLQNHGGVFRSDDGGTHWTECAAGLPSDFGFPMTTHPRDGGTAYIIPLQADHSRWTVGGQLRVYRTRDGGQWWEATGKGLPDKNAYEVILRDGMCTDTLRPAGVYFGTKSGKVYGSADDGDSWRLLTDGLPPVMCVRAMVN